MVENLDQNQEIIALTAELGSDGFLVENVASRIASTVANIRSQSQSILDAVPKVSFDQFSSLKQILGEKAEIVKHAVRAGIHSSENDWKLLKQASNLSALREAALKLKLPDSMTLGDKIRQLTTPTTTATL